MMTKCLPIEPAILFETAHDIPSIVPNPLEEGSGEIPRIKEHNDRVAVPARADIAEPR